MLEESNHGIREIMWYDSLVHVEKYIEQQPSKQQEGRDRQLILLVQKGDAPPPPSCF